MIKYIIKRVLLMIPTVFLLTIIVFAVIHMVPGDPITVMFGFEGSYPEEIARIQKFYNLDKPVYVQYALWMKQILRLDFGNSIVRGDPILPMILKRYPRTLILTTGSMLVALVFGVPMALASAKKHNTMLDVAVSGVSLTFISMPSFWLAIIFILVFGVILNILPATSHTFASGSPWNFIKTLIMPCVSTGLITSAGITRMLRTELVDNLHKDYILFARTKGASDNRALMYHNLRNAVIATATVVALQMGYLMGGVIIIERVFTFPGMGQLLLDAVTRRDYPIIQVTVLVFALTFVLINFLTDLLYAFLDPRIRYQ
jgi:peptide/nickel transport system permease protein